MMYRLVHLKTDRGAIGNSWTLQLPATVGRGSEASVSIDDESISRTHCQIFLAPDESLMVRDLNSMNGTYINGDRIRAVHSLVPGDVLQLGSVSLRVDYSSDTDPGPAPPAPAAKASTNATQKLDAIPMGKFTMREVQEPSKRWWEFWKTD